MSMINSNSHELVVSDQELEEFFDETYQFGPILLDHDECTQHFLYGAATGGGKTTNIRLLMQDVMRDIRIKPDTRALIYDAKQDQQSILAGIDPHIQVVTFDPFDARGAAWDMAADVQEPRVAIEIAFTLIPETQESQPFFSSAARHLLVGVMTSFMVRKLDWLLGDVIRALSSPRKLRRVLAACKYTRGLISKYFGDPKLLANILSTVATKLLPFEPIAACWDSATKRVSLEHWVEGNFVVILGNSETSRHAIDALNRCIFKRAVDLHLNQSESTTRRTWWFVDEVSEAGRLDGMKSLLKKSRSKGGCVVLAFQSIEGLRDTKLYGPNETAEIIGQIGHKCIGRLECPETAEWAARIFGEQEIRQVTNNRSWSASSGKDGGSSSYSFSENEQFVTQRSVLPSEFLSLPPCNDINGLSAYYLSRVTGAFWSHIGGDELFGEALLPRDTNVKDFVPRPIESQFLEPWTKAQAAAFAPPYCRRRKAKPKPSERKRNLEALKELGEFFRE